MRVNKKLNVHVCGWFLFFLVWAGPEVTPMAHAGKFEGTKTFSLDTAYVPMLASNRAMWGFGLEWEYLGITIFDGIGDGTFIGQTFPTRLLWGAAMHLGWMFPQYSFFVSNHELGHGTRFIAEGGSPRYTWTSGGGDHTSIFSFFLIGLFKHGDGAYANSAGGSGRAPSNWSLVVGQGGMNNSMMFAEALEDEVATNGGHINQILAYYRAKKDPYEYALSTERGFQGDVSNTQSMLAAQGISVSTNDFKTGTIASILLSSTTWSYVYSFARYVAAGDPNVSHPRAGAFRLPDVSFFQNRSGLSFRARMALDYSDHSIPFSLETVYRGRTALEASAGYQSLESQGSKKRIGLGLQGYASTLGGFGMRISRESQAGQSTLFGYGGSVYTSNSLEGERNGGRWLTSFLALDLWARLRFVF